MSQVLELCPLKIKFFSVTSRSRFLKTTNASSKGSWITRGHSPSMEDLLLLLSRGGVYTSSLESGLVLWLALANKLWQKKCHSSSKPRPQEALQLSPHLGTLMITRESLGNLWEDERPLERNHLSWAILGLQLSTDPGAHQGSPGKTWRATH